MNEFIDNMGIVYKDQTVKINRITELKITSDIKPEYDSDFLNDYRIRLSISPDPHKEYIRIIAELEEIKENQSKKGSRKSGIRDYMTPKPIEEVTNLFRSIKPEKYYKYLGKAFLLNINVVFQGKEIKNIDLLYFTFDNISFFREFIIKNNIPVKTIVSVRDQMAENSKANFWEYLSEYSSIDDLICENHLILDFEQDIINGTPEPENLRFQQIKEFRWNESDQVTHFRIIRQ